VLNIDLASGKFGGREASPVFRRCGGGAEGEFEFEFAGRVRLLLASLSLEGEPFFFPLSLSPPLPPKSPMVLSGSL
jgi:hypothetical protein